MTDTAATSVRAFLAISIAPSIRDALVKLKTELASTGADVRWVRDEGLHATIKFLGSVGTDTLERIRAALDDALRAQLDFTVRVRGLGVFPNLRRPRVIWVGLQAPPELVALARRVEEIVEPFGFAPEKRPFQPHLTLGRVNGTRGWPRLEEMLKAHWNDDWGVSRVREIDAFRSELRRGGAVYTRMWTIPLGGSRGGRDGNAGE